MTDTPDTPAAPSARVAAVDIEFGRALERRNLDLLECPSQEQIEAEQAKSQKSLAALLAGLPVAVAQAVRSLTPKENMPSSAKPKELTAPVPLPLLEQTVRECPELSRAIAAITVGVGSRGFSLVPVDPETADSPEAQTERLELEAFFKYLCPNRSFSQVMKITVSARKRFAFAAWEILRNDLNQVVGVNPIEDTKTLSWCLLDEQFIEVNRQIRIGDRIETIPEMRKFRRFAQTVRGSKWGAARKVTYFKEFGNPLPLNRETGEYHTGNQPPGPTFPAATELLIFPVVDAGGEHPQPEWIPVLPDALASRAIRVINLDTLNNGATPPFLVIIEGTADEAQLSKVIDQFKDIKGETSRRRAIFVQLDSQTIGTGTAKEAMAPKIRIEPMAQLMTTEGMFLKYLAWLEKSIAAALRLPLLLVGNIDSTLNRATAEAALVYAEDQVFAPERQDIEDVINDQLLPEASLFGNRTQQIKGVRFWRFKLNGYNADKTADYLKLLAVEKGALSLNEKRTVLDALLPDQKLPVLTDEAANQPTALPRPSQSPADRPSDGLSELEQLPEDAALTQALKQQIAQHLNKPASAIKSLYFYEEAA